MDKSSFLIYLDYEEQFNLLTDEQLGQLMRAIIKYEKTKDIPKLDGVLKMAFSFIKTQLDRDRDKYVAKCEKNKENGAKGGRPKKNNITTINGAEIPEGEIEGKHFLYFIYDKKTGLHKVGETKNLKQRRYDIKKPTNDLIIIDYYLGTMFECQKYENEILEKYKKYSVGGDWFNLPEEKAKEILTKYFLKPSGYLENHSVAKKADKDKEDEEDIDNEEEILKKEKIKKEKSFQDVFNENNFSNELTNSLKDFIVMRKTIKKPMTTKALELLLKNLDRLTNLEAEKIAILNQSIENGWQTVYPLKNLEEKKNFDKQKNTSKESEFFEYDTSILTQEEYGKLMKGQMSKDELKQIVKDRTGEKNV